MNLVELDSVDSAISRNWVEGFSTDMYVAVALPCRSTLVISATRRPKQRTKEDQNLNKKQSVRSVGGFGGLRNEPLWGCVDGCGACCKLAKGPSFASPEEIFSDPSDIQLYNSLIGPDGWCIHYEKSTRKCSIYADRPYFCRVEPGVFKTLYGIDKKRFNKEACSSCRDTIKSVYGKNSKEFENFNDSVRSSVAASEG